MDYRRLNIAELAIETNTPRCTLHQWINSGYLIPTQISGNRKKFSLDAFLKAEKEALKSKKIKYDRFTSGGRIPDDFFDNIEMYLDD